MKWFIFMLAIGAIVGIVILGSISFTFVSLFSAPFWIVYASVAVGAVGGALGMLVYSISQIDWH